MDQKKQKKRLEFSCSTLVIPLMVLLLIFYSAIIVLVYYENRTNNDLSEMLQDSSKIRQELDDMQAGMSILSQTMTSFVLQPVVGENSPNVGPLKQYASELARDRRGPQVAARLKEQDINEEAQGYADSAANYTTMLMEMEIHAFSLVRSVYQLPPIPELQTIPTVSLTDEESAMSAGERLAAARNIILRSEYGQTKNRLMQDAASCNESLQNAFLVAYDEASERVSFFRTWIWVDIILHAVISLIILFLFYYLLMMPLHRYARHIEKDRALNANGFVKELNLVADAYNELLDRRSNLENLLRSAAETDALTGLPNRYCLDSNLAKICAGGGSMTVMLFDVNYLKKINDTKGHLEGDRVIRVAGACISDIFGEVGNCFRIGGDEFIAILKSHTEQDVSERLTRFQEEQSKEKISVSVGYAYADDVSDERSFKRLLREADAKMYEKKKKLHDESDN